MKCGGHELNVMCDNLYERLGITEDASGSLIKSSFFELVRQYPPERKPDEYGKLREAYDTLIHSVSRSEYDASLTYGAEIKHLEEQINEAFEDEDDNTAQKFLKRLVNLAPGVAIFRNRLGLTFLRTDEHSSAIKQFARALEIDPSNPVYVLNKGIAERKLGDFWEAEESFRKSWNLDPKDYSAPRALADLYYHDLERREEAYQIIEDAISVNGGASFNNFFLLYDKVHFYLFEDDRAGLNRELERIIGFANDQQEKEFAAYLLHKSALQLWEYSVFELAAKFAGAAQRLDHEEPIYLEFLRECENHSENLADFKKFTEREDIHNFVKHLLYLYGARYYGEMEDSEFNEQIEDLGEVVTNVMSVDPDNTQIKNSLGDLNNNYPRLYDLNSKLFNSILQWPVATSVSYPCPNCGDRVKVRKFDYGRYGCPHCNSGIEYGSGGYSRISPAESFFDGCFIATAVYGDPIHPKVCLLRKVRNELLVQHCIGRVLVRLYYRISPSISKCLKPDSSLSTVIRRMVIDPICSIGSLCIRILAKSNGRNRKTATHHQLFTCYKELEKYQTW